MATKVKLKKAKTSTYLSGAELSQAQQLVRDVLATDADHKKAYDDLKALVGAASNTELVGCFEEDSKLDAKDAVISDDKKSFADVKTALESRVEHYAATPSAPVVSSSPVTPLSPSPSPLPSDAKTATATDEEKKKKEDKDAKVVDTTLSASMPPPAPLPDEAQMTRQNEELAKLREQFQVCRGFLTTDLEATRPVEQRITTNALGIVPQVSQPLIAAEEKEHETRRRLEECSVACKKAEDNDVGVADARATRKLAEEAFKKASEEAEKLRKEEQQKIAAALYRKYSAEFGASWQPLPDAKAQPEEHNRQTAARRDYLVALADMEAWLIVNRHCLSDIVKKDEKDKGKPVYLDAESMMSWRDLMEKMAKRQTDYKSWLAGLSKNEKKPTLDGELSIYSSKDGKSVTCGKLDPNSIPQALKALNYLLQHVPPNSRSYMLTSRNLSKDVEKALMRQILTANTTVYVSMDVATVKSTSVRRILEQQKRLTSPDAKGEATSVEVPNLAVLWVDACKNRNPEDRAADKAALIEVLRGADDAADLFHTLWQQLCELPLDPKDRQQVMRQLLEASVGRKLKTLGTTAKTVLDLLEEYFLRPTVSVGAESIDRQWFKAVQEIKTDEKYEFIQPTLTRKERQTQAIERFKEPCDQFKKHQIELKKDTKAAAAPLAARS